jgi:hypothetical protein
MTDTNLAEAGDDTSMIKIHSDNWVATVLSLSHPSEGFFHIYATTIGETKEDAFAGAEYVLNAFAFGRLALIRAKPEANSETDFDTKLTRHKGFVRFSYRLEAGEWQYPDPPVMAGLGSVA